MFCRKCGTQMSNGSPLKSVSSMLVGTLKNAAEARMLATPP